VNLRPAEVHIKMLSSPLPFILSSSARQLPLPLRCSSCTCPAARPWCCGPGAGAHALSVGWGVVCGGLTSALPPPSLSALYPATAARQGGRVAASRMDSCEFRTADKRG